MAKVGVVVRCSLIAALILGPRPLAQAADQEPVVTAADLFARCISKEAERQVCYAYIRGFSDGNRWLVKDEPVAVGVPTPQAVCVPNAEPLRNAAELFVSRFRDRANELQHLSPFRALSMALAQRYACR